MTPAAILVALSERCRKEKASFELDREIAEVVGWRTVNVGRGRPAWRSPSGEEWSSVPSYTRRVDDAIEIIPKGCVWVLEVSTRQRWATIYQSVLMERKWGVSGKTPALALCAAALLSRAAIRALLEEGLK